MVRVVVLGAGGRMGQEVCRALGDAEDMEVVAAVDPRHAGTDLRELAGARLPALPVRGDVCGLEEAGIDVAVDFTAPAAALANLRWCVAHGVHAVVGTTGFTAQELEWVESAFEGAAANALIAPNFAIGAVLVMRFCELAAPYMTNVEIIELHHDGKRDAPSGTALRSAERIAKARKAAGCVSFPDDPTMTATLEGARGGAGPGGVRLHSVRLPGLVAHQEVIFGSRGETVVLRHDSVDRACFMAGVLLAVREIGSLRGVTIGLEGLLGW